MTRDETVTMSLERYAPDAKAWVVAAQALADRRRNPEVSPLHLLADGLERDPAVLEVFRKAGVPVVELSNAVERALGALPRGDEPAYLSQRFLDLLSRAEREATRERAAVVRTDHLLSALSQEVRGPAGEVLGAFGVGPGSLAPHLGVLKNAPRQPARNGAEASGPFTRDLVEGSRSGAHDPVVGRDAELTRLVTILERRNKCHPLLVGEPGIGKSAIVRALADRLVKGTVPAPLSGARLLEIDVGSLVAGARLKGDVENRMRRLLDEARNDTGRVTILFVRGIEQMLDGNAGAAGDVLRGALDEGRVRLIGTTTPEGARRIGEKEPELLRVLTPLRVEEPTSDAAKEMLRGVRARYEEHHGVSVSDAAISAAVTLAKRYLKDAHLPDSALDLMDEAAAALRVKLGPRPKAGGALPELSEEHVAGTLAEWTGVPVAKMLEAEADKLMKMEERLEQRVIGQSEAVRALSRAVRRGRVGLRDPKRPIGSFLFLGPSGVGKTELAKALAEFLFDDEGALTRLDMSEFMERHMAQRLLGAPPGYADSEQGGFLTEAVRRRPYSVLLFDEVEKAHQDVFNLLLQVLDDGRLTDGRGRLADFTNTVVIMTSNIGSERILGTDEKLFDHEEGREALRDVLVDQLGQFFRPEFLNRVDDIIVFRPLSREHLRRIVDIQLDQVRRLLAPRQVTLEVEDSAKDALVELGYQPALGARPLRRAIVRQIQDPLAEALLTGGHAAGSTIRVRHVDDEFVFDKA